MKGLSKRSMQPNSTRWLRSLVPNCGNPPVATGIRSPICCVPHFDRHLSYPNLLIITTYDNLLPEKEIYGIFTKINAFTWNKERKFWGLLCLNRAIALYLLYLMSHPLDTYRPAPGVQSLRDTGLVFAHIWPFLLIFNATCVSPWPFHAWAGQCHMYDSTRMTWICPRYTDVANNMWIIS